MPLPNELGIIKGLRGSAGFTRINAASGTVTGNFYAVFAANNQALTFDSGTTVSAGTSPGATADALGVGQVLLAPFTAIDISAGVAYAYDEET